ncbi:hypothetical protein NQL31_003779 [Lotmaria passim]
MWNTVKRNDDQRPPWRHSEALYDDDSGEETALDAQLRRHAPRQASPSSRVTTGSSNSKRPLRPPPLFRPHADDNHHHHRLTSSAEVSDAVSSSSVPSSSFSSSTQQGQRRPLNAPDAAVHVPVTHWQQGEDAGRASRHGRRSVERRRLVEESPLLHTSGAVEHYHVLELEEQLQYWRQRALQMESRQLQRERSIKERYAADFAAAQTTSEAVIRQLLDKQQRLHQLLLEERQRGVRASQMATAAQLRSASSTSIFSHSSDTSLTRHRDRKVKSRRDDPQRAQAGRERDSFDGIQTPTPHPDDEQTMSQESQQQQQKRQSSADQKNSVDTRALQLRVMQLTRENAALSDALAAAAAGTQEQPQAAEKSSTPDAVTRQHRATSTEPSLTDSTADRDRQAGIGIEAEKSRGSAELLKRLEQRLRDVAQIFLLCFQHSAELRRLCTVLCNESRDRGSNGSRSKSQSSSREATDAEREEEQHRRITQLLAESCHATSEANSRDGTATKATAAQGEALSHQLTTLRDAAAFLDALLLNCVDDIVLARSRQGEEKTRLQLQEEEEEQQQQRVQEATADVRASLASLQQLHEHCKREHEKELQAVHASAAQQADRHATASAAAAEELQKARREVQQLVKKQQEHEAQVSVVREGCAQELWEAARRVSAAEHAAALHADREAQWRTRLSAIEDARDAYAQECAILKSRLEVLQARETNTNERQRRRHDSSRNSVAVEAVLSNAQADAAAAVQREERKSSSGSTVTAKERRPTASPSVAVEAQLRDMHDDAITPRRSLSYSPPESAERPAPQHPQPLQTIPANEKTEMGRSNPTMKGAAAGEAIKAGATRVMLDTQRFSSSAAATASSSSPMYAVQPSRFAAPTARDGATALALDGKRVEDAVNSQQPQPVSEADATPLARMKAWEEKFKSILAPP